MVASAVWLPSPIPPRFGPGASFYDCEAGPVSISKGQVLIWPNGKPRPYPLERVLQSDPPIMIGEARFRYLMLDRWDDSLPIDRFARAFSELSPAAAILALNRAAKDARAEDETRNHTPKGAP